MYVFRTRGAQTTLIEMTHREYLAALEHEFKTVSAPEPKTRHKRTTAEEARRYVKDGGHHETGLWVDDGKVRYAKADPTGC
ncbi:hypothetical protein [Rhizobium sp. SSA_523]|uniref:hypothetical protein n=1 Tax=Rhizobium sp. SSA_523 TaxID=2952477 RepID=UPI0020912833|nr:hypothetical protein [Rhizobium sp. SSA_523]MCO5730116.1 hypothetical protein [Rhizobium sp. SSA_523]WKC25181.1 hypothetical protein QTJ18_14430 [Rhizobium sp. SSA_523]